jgi:hypothetical protein
MDGKNLVSRQLSISKLQKDLDVTSAGSIERDQQGSNKYNYNYWSSPVSPINTTKHKLITVLPSYERRNDINTTKHKLDLAMDPLPLLA